MAGKIERALLLLAALTTSTACASGKYAGLARTPPMGWNSWNKFACDVNESLIRETADAMASSGMKDAGYRYVILDDCWHGERAPDGRIEANRERFPSGIKALADHVHARGLALGIYSDAGAKTCGGRPGSGGHELVDASTYAAWGVDYLKYDWCNTEGMNAEAAYTLMRDSLRKAGRPIVFSMCEWGESKPWTWAQGVGHLWRTTGDITACFDCVKDHGTWKSWGVLQILDKQRDLRAYAGPDHWNDPDMLEVGNGMSESEDRAHFSMWAMLAAPLVAGNDLRHMSKETRAILTNASVIAVDQDPLGVQGFKHSTKDGVETWLRPLQGGAWAVCFLNRGTAPAAIELDWKQHPITDELSKRTLNAAQTSYRIDDLWAKKSAGTTDTSLEAIVPAHDVVMFKLSPQ